MATDSAFFNPFFYEDSWSEYGASFTRGDLGTDGGFECTREFEPAVLKDFYKYEPITQRLLTSRVLVLYPGDDSEPLRGRLESLYIGQGQEYQALSYVWGTSNMVKAVLIEGKKLSVTESLWRALRNFRSKEQARWIWIDQICINQKDNIERNHQVGLMHAIFREASEVLVWLGPDTNRQARDAFKLVRSLNVIMDDELLGSLCRAPGARCDWIPEKHWRALRELVHLPWFLRAWIPQEIGTEAPATIHWGTDSIDWTVLSQAMIKLERCWELRMAHGIDTTRVTLLYRRFVADSGTERDPGSLGFVLQLCHTSRTLATDPRDYVFSQLGHHSAWIESEGAMIIQPDYDNSAQDIYHEVAIRAFKASTSLMVLNAVADRGIEVGRRMTLPSWAPRWDAGRFHNTIGYPGRYQASGSSWVVQALRFDDAHLTLFLEGFVVDSIARQADKPFEKLAKPYFSASGRPKLVGLLRNAWAVCGPGDGDSRFAKFTTKPKYRDDASVPALRAFLDTLGPAPRVAQLDSKAGAYRSGVAVLEKLFPPAMFSSKNDPRKTAGAEDRGQPAKEIRESVWLQAAGQNATNRKFAVTKQGHFVMAPPTIRRGDLLCVLFGGETPYVLRRLSGNGDSDQTVYQFVGEAYTYGLMKGEAMEMFQAGKFPPITFRIR